jgi:hypothetical protein
MRLRFDTTLAGRTAGVRHVVALLALVMCLVPVPGDRTRASVPVDLTLVLAIDCSYSVDSREFALQIEGMSRAFRDPEVIKAIAEGPLGRIAVSVVQWSDASHQRVAVPWTVIIGEGDAHGLAGRLATLPRLLADGGTSITAMIRFGAKLLNDSPVAGQRQVIDIAADGRNNNGGYPKPVRDDVAEQGITINGLAILNEVPTLGWYFEQNVIVGPGSFVVVANDYAAYADAIKRKLLREIIGPTLS